MALGVPATAASRRPREEGEEPAEGDAEKSAERDRIDLSRGEAGPEPGESIDPAFLLFAHGSLGLARSGAVGKHSYKSRLRGATP